MSKFLSWCLQVALWTVALMSGVISVFREGWFLYRGQTPTRGAYWSWIYIAFVVSAFVCWWKEHAKVLRYEKGRPELKVPESGFYVKGVDFSMVVKSPHITQKQTKRGSSICLRIVNDPRTSTEHSEAKQVGATVSISNLKAEKLFTFEARWADTDQPSTIEPGKTTYHLLRVDMPIGATREMDIAFKYPEDQDCYAFNNDSYGFAWYQNPAWKLGPGKYIAQVRLRGLYVDSTLILEFENPGAGYDLKAMHWKVKTG